MSLPLSPEATTSSLTARLLRLGVPPLQSLVPQYRGYGRASYHEPESCSSGSSGCIITEPSQNPGPCYCRWSVDTGHIELDENTVLRVII